MENPPRVDVERAKQILERELPLLREKYNVRSLGLFGSYVRQEQTPESDLGILVSFLEPPFLLQFVALEYYLSDLLDVPVDSVMQDALKPHLGQRIMREVVST